MDIATRERLARLIVINKALGNRYTYTQLVSFAKFGITGLGVAR